MDEKYAAHLAELAVKYSAAEDGLKTGFEPGAVLVQCSKGNFRFFYDFSAELPDDAFVNVPLFYGRSRRRYQELKHILDMQMIREPVAMRIKHIASRDLFTAGMRELMTSESDLAEFILGQRVTEVFADLHGEEYMNCIASTECGVKISMELGFLPEGSEPVILHEIVARTGIASDVAVDTQTQQYPVYVFRGEKTVTYSDMDAELYGLSPAQTDSIRFVLWALSEQGRIEQLKQDAEHETNVWSAVKRSAEKIRAEKVSV